MNESGFITLHRKMLNSWVHCLNDADFRLAVTCICMANWKPGKWFDGVEQLDIDRGSFVTTVAKLTFEMGKDSTPKKVRNGLRRLTAAEFLKTGKTSGKRYTYITIMNYSQYQDKDAQPGKTSGNERANGGQTVGNERATIEQGNKGTTETKKQSKAAQLPESWEPNDNHAAKAASICVDLAEQVESFRDHHLAKGSTMKDWGRAFNTWLRNAERFAKEREAKAPRGPEVNYL